MGNWGRLREPRQGVMLHYDGSATDAGAVRWLTQHPDARVSYTRLVLDDGQVIPIAPDDARAWHAGNCRPSSEAFTYTDANSAFYGLAFAARPGDTITPPQFHAMLKTILRCYADEGWPLTDWWRITDHAREAWPRGRKVDIGTGLLYAGQPLTLDIIRQAVTSC